MKVNEISLMIGGEAGAGITAAGFFFGKTCLRGGLFVFGANDYQSLIRGGHNFYIARVEDEEVYSQPDYVDLLLALNKETILLHRGNLNPGGGIVYDEEEVTLAPEELGRSDVKLFPVPLAKVVKGLGGEPIVRNMVALGAAVALVDYDIEMLLGVLGEEFKGKVAEVNLKAAREGFDYAQQHYRGDFPYRLTKLPQWGRQRMLLTGNEAIGLGVIGAGCKFYAAYPMTPETPLLHFMAAHDREFGTLVLQPESEIAAINMAMGASFAGVRAVAATSGGGFSLMAEGLGAAAMTETPVVVVLGQRPGPSTGLPTFTSQADLRFAIHASQGEFPRVVVAPGDAEECFYKTMEAFNLAEKYQVPVILIVDKHLVESHWTYEPFDPSRIRIDRGLLIAGEYKGEGEYKRHQFTEDGISPRAIPSTKGAIVRTNGDEHDEYGYTTEDPDLTTKMNDKRFKKLGPLMAEMGHLETVKLWGPKTADITILGWGSTKGAIREAMKLLAQQGVRVNYLQIIYLNPFPSEAVRRIVSSARKTVVVENNKTSQLTSLIRENLLMDVERKILQYNGRPFNPGALAQRTREVM